MTPTEAASLILEAYRANSQVVSVEIAKLVRDDWDLLCGRVSALTAEHAATIAKLTAERDQALEQLAAFHKALDKPVDELIRLREWAGGQS